MPRFFFDVVENGRTIQDDDGVELLSLEAARLEAGRTAGEMLRDRTQEKADPADICLIVRDGSPEPVCSVVVALKIL